MEAHLPVCGCKLCFYPLAKSYLNQRLPSVYKRLEQRKKREYGKRVQNVDAGTFTPMVMASTGGMGREMDMAIKRLASELAERRGEDYSQVCGLVRCRFAFVMQRAALVCLRGSRSRYRRDYCGLLDTPADVVLSEARV